MKFADLMSWDALSSLVHVTVAPRATVRVEGLKANPLMVTEVPPTSEFCVGADAGLP